MSIDLSSYTTPKVLLGLLGQNILKSLSPAMHQQEGKAQGLNVFYQLIDFATFEHTENTLGEVFTAAKRMGFAGLNITFPYKQSIIPFLDELSADAAAIGAVNTVVFKHGRSCGYNTDCSGYQIALRDKLSARPVGRVVQVGAGGAGSAVAHGIMGLNASHLTLVDTDTAKAQALAESLAKRFGADRVSIASHAQAALSQADGLVNATPLGMAGIGGMCVPADWIHAKHWVSDVVYSPLETEMLRLACSKGCTTIAGDGMNLWQAVEAFELFTGISPDAVRMGAYHKTLFAHRGM